ncbi:hypothetical protein OG711_35850 [Streptomyces uncialis]|uniref:hypothetical protein n=1 Tax=Streptomyces uncialis TaxID=1048205 RepID=UPI002E35E89A|nr:hypothetical protein [Streptomyces uncialis]
MAQDMFQGSEVQGICFVPVSVVVAYDATALGGVVVHAAQSTSAASRCPAGAFAVGPHFRDDLFGCLPARGAMLFELTDASPRADRPMTTPVDLTLTPGVGAGTAR